MLRRTDVGLAVTTIAAVLATFGTTLALDALVGLGPSILVLGVALSLTLGRVGAGHGIRQRLISLVFMPVVAIAGFGVGYLLVFLPIVGSILFVIALGLSVWLRRFGPLASRVGAFIALPFVAVLLTPAPAVSTSGGATFLFWVPLVSLVAAGWATLAHLVAEKLGFVEHTPVADAPRRAPSPGTLLPSTRMAIQLVVALAAAFLVGHLLLGMHWPWVVITAYVVTSGNRGRGDVAYKGVLRVIGALAGVAIATVLSILFPPGDAVAIVWMFVALAIGTLLRGINYAFWAASITAVLALLYEYFGEGGEQLLVYRLLGVLIGGVLAVASAWFILPIRSGDVLRSRMFGALNALSDVLGAARTEPEKLPDAAARYAGSLRAIEQIAPTLLAADLLLRVFRQEPRHGHVVRALRDCAHPVSELAAAEPSLLAEPAEAKLVGATARDVGTLRRALADRTAPEFAEVQPWQPWNDVSAALLAIDTTIRAWRA